MVCSKEGGIQACTFVGEFLGEMYSPWAWAERQVRKLFENRECRVFPV